MKKTSNLVPARVPLTPIASFIAPDSPSHVAPTPPDPEEVARVFVWAQAFLEANPVAVYVHGADGGPLNVAASLEATIASIPQLPRTCTQAIAEVLSMEPFDVRQIAVRFRDVGTKIAETPEAEEAFVKFWALGFALKHDAEWKAYAAAALPAKKVR